MKDSFVLGIQKRCMIFCFISSLFILVLFITTSNFSLPPLRKIMKECETDEISTEKSYTVWPEFMAQKYTNVELQCKRTISVSIANLSLFIQSLNETENPLCRELYKRFTAIYLLDHRVGTVSIPQTFIRKVKGWLGNQEELYGELFHQDIIHVTNQYTHETTVFNPLRDKRPVKKPTESEEDYVKRITNESKANCDFCNYKWFTAQHTIGRLETNLSFTASNIFKLDTWHCVVTMKQHDPINWTFAQYQDMMMLSMKWMKKANLNDTTAKYPSMIWDLLPKSGSSQIHPHNQVFLSPHRYQGMVEAWRRSAQTYYNDYQRNYFTDLVSVYSMLGLAVHYKSAVAIASLTPRKDNEVVVLAEKYNEDFTELIYLVLRAFLDDLSKYSFSLGGGFPAVMDGVSEGNIPAFVRIITRGVATEIRTDISALELFTATNVNIDPFKVIQVIRSSVTKRAFTLQHNVQSSKKFRSFEQWCYRDIFALPHMRNKHSILVYPTQSQYTDSWPTSRSTTPFFSLQKMALFKNLS